MRADGTPIALCIIKANTKDSKPINSEELFGMAAASWNSDRRAYFLIGGETAPTTQSEAKAKAKAKAKAFEIWAATVSDI